MRDLDYDAGRLGYAREIALRIKVEVNAGLIRQSCFDLSRHLVNEYLIAARFDGADHLANDIDWLDLGKRQLGYHFGIHQAGVHADDLCLTSRLAGIASASVMLFGSRAAA
jgi:hypothetical protein